MATKKLKKSTGKVKYWEQREEDPYRVYQELLAKIVAGFEWDEEENRFFKYVELMLKTGELTVAKQDDKDYVALVQARVQRDNPNKIVSFYKKRDLPVWFSKYLSTFNEWQKIPTNYDKTEKEFRDENKIKFEYEYLEIEEGYALKWDEEKQQSFTFLKFSN